MKLLTFALPLVALLTLAPQVARAGCPQSGSDGCDAVTKLEAKLEGAPMCLRLDGVEPENGCVCQGSFNLVNECAFDVTTMDFGLNGADTATIPAGETVSLDVRGSDSDGPLGGPPGVHHREINLEANGQSFKLLLDFTVEHRSSDVDYGCSASGAGKPGASGLGLGLGLAALLLARRRSSAR